MARRREVIDRSPSLASEIVCKPPRGPTERVRTGTRRSETRSSSPASHTCAAESKTVGAQGSPNSFSSCVCSGGDPFSWRLRAPFIVAGHEELPPHRVNGRGHGRLYEES